MKETVISFEEKRKDRDEVVNYLDVRKAMLKIADGESSSEAIKSAYNSMANLPLVVLFLRKYYNDDLEELKDIPNDDKIFEYDDNDTYEARVAKIQLKTNSVIDTSTFTDYDMKMYNLLDEILRVYILIMNKLKFEKPNTRLRILNDINKFIAESKKEGR